MPAQEIGSSADVRNAEGCSTPGDRGRGGGTPLRFRSSCVFPESRVFVRDGGPVSIGARAFDLLVVLLRARGAIVEKNEILGQVWPSTIVEESNLRFQMASLRRALGQDSDLIKTIPGRGYVFASDFALDDTAGAGSVRQYDSVTGNESPPIRFESASETPTPVKTSDIVLIDDDSNVREALVALLRSAGMSVHAFSSVRDYQNAGERPLPACLILDVWMPERTGLEFQSDLAGADIRPPVIFISGHADIPMSVRAMKAGAFEFLTKPVRHEELLGAIKLAIGKGSSSGRPAETITRVEPHHLVDGPADPQRAVVVRAVRAGGYGRAHP